MNFVFHAFSILYLAYAYAYAYARYRPKRNFERNTTNDHANDSGEFENNEIAKVDRTADSTAANDNKPTNDNLKPILHGAYDNEAISSHIEIFGKGRE